MFFRRRFKNPHIRHVRRSLFDFFLWLVGYYKEKPPGPPPEGFVYPNPEKAVKKEEPTIQWIGHSSFVARVSGITVLTDPVWSDYCAPLPRCGPKRNTIPPYDINNLSHVDMVLLSHNHYDHMDRKTIMQLNSRFPDIQWVVPQNLGRWLKKRGIHNVTELGWWQRREFSFGQCGNELFEVTAVPTQHFSGRGLFDKNKTLWCGFVLTVKKDAKKYKTLYFVGDSGYNPHDFKEIGRIFGGFDLSLVPIGTYVPRPFMETVHVDPEHAVKIHQEVGSLLSVAMHHLTFKLSEEPLSRPPYDLHEALQKAQIDPLQFRVIGPGQEINW